MDKKEYMKEYQKNNKEKLKEYNKKYRENNKQKIEIQKKEYSKEYNKTDNAKKSQRICKWRKRGVVSDDFEILYKIYLSVKFCDICNCELNTNTKTRKCLDHCHKSGYFRNILCNSCNVKIK